MQENAKLAAEAGGHPCTHAGCDCKDFVSGGGNSVTCKCGHASDEHGLP
jgi:hypothetical protein